jgi:hypothetical protein
MNEDSIYPIFIGFKKIIQDIKNEDVIREIYDKLKIYARNNTELLLMESLIDNYSSINLISITKFINKIKNINSKNQHEALDICNNILANIDDPVQIAVLESIIDNIEVKKKK